MFRPPSKTSTPENRLDRPKATVFALHLELIWEIGLWNHSSRLGLHPTLTCSFVNKVAQECKEAAIVDLGVSNSAKLGYAFGRAGFRQGKEL